MKHDASLLLSEFPYMFRGCWPLEIFRGWTPLVVRACIRVDRLLDDQDKDRFRWWTVREKFGALCFGYCLAGPGGDALPEGWELGDKIELTSFDEIDSIVETAERASLHQCVLCGSVAELRQVDGFQLVICPEHHATWKNILAKAFPAQHINLILQASIEPDFLLHWRPFLPLLQRDP